MAARVPAAATRSARKIPLPLLRLPGLQQQQPGGAVPRPDDTSFLEAAAVDDAVAAAAAATPGEHHQHHGARRRWRSLPATATAGAGGGGAELLQQHHQRQQQLEEVAKACTARRDPQQARAVQAAATRAGLDAHPVVGNLLIRMHAACGDLAAAGAAFGRVPAPDPFAWVSMMTAQVELGRPEQAVALYRRMMGMRDRTGAEQVGNEYVVVAALKACGAAGELESGRMVHGHARRAGLDRRVFVGNSLVCMYARCGSVEEARAVFDGMPERDAVSWNAMMGGYVRRGRAREALDMFDAMVAQQVQGGAGVVPDRVTFLAAVKACGALGSLPDARRVHAQVLAARGVTGSVGNALVDMYARCGSLGDARAVFDGLPDRDVVAWNAMIGAYAQHCATAAAAVELFGEMLHREQVPDNVTYASVLKACGKAGDLEAGKRVHRRMVETPGHRADGVVENALVHMYAKCGSLGDARAVFDGRRGCRRDAVAWNAMIAGYAEAGRGDEALELYRDMRKQQQEQGGGGEAAAPDVVTAIGVLKACHSCANALDRVREVHAEVRAWAGGEQVLADSHVQSALVDAYVKCGSVREARAVFDGLGSSKGLVTWSAMIAGYAADNAGGEEAVRLFDEMVATASVVPDAAVFASVVKACGSVGCVAEGRRVHAQVVERGLEQDAVVGAALVDMYVKCGSLDDARAVFDALGCSSLSGEVAAPAGVVAWSAMLAGYAQAGRGDDALALYRTMPASIIPDAGLVVAVLQACGSARAAQEGKRLHALAKKAGLESDPFVASALVDMYAKCGLVEDARAVFDAAPGGSRTVVTWSAMIAGYAQAGRGRDALDLYARMQAEEEGGVVVAPNRVTLLCLLKACGSVGALKEGCQIHAALMPEDGGDWGAAAEEECVKVGNAVVDMYVKCASLEDARLVFDSLVNRGSADVVSWSSLMAGYVQHGCFHQALSLFQAMLAGSVVSPNEATLVQAIKASGMVGATLDGRHAHALARRRGLDTTAVVVGNALVDMYGRWGCVEEAQGVFDRIPHPDVVSWTALIHAYGQHNRGREAVERFLDMQRHGVRPNGSTFTAVLVACSHAGMVDAGAACLRSMAAEHGLVPAPEHVTCAADMLARAGRLDDAEAVLLGAGEAGGTADRVGWMALLSACRAHGGQVDLARRCFDRLLALGSRADQEEEEAANSAGRRAPEASGYVVMAKVYAEAGMPREAAAVEAARRAAGARKKPARATVEVGAKVWEFVVGGARPDTSAKLANLNLRATTGVTATEEAAAAAVPAADEAAAAAAQEEEQEEEAAGLCAHAEKLALAFGLLNTPAGAPLLINKNLRMCDHCHSGTKMVSRLEKRQITVRDAHRVHHFVDGVCSCGDRF